MRRGWVALVVIALLTAMAAYYHFSNREYVFRFTENQLQGKLDAKLPFTRSYFLIFQVTVDNPRISLADESGRVRTGLDVTLNIRIGDEPKQLGGTVDVSSRVKYVPEKGQFFLTDPMVEHLAIQGIPPRYSQDADAAITQALSAYYSEHPIYTLKRTDVKQAAARLVLKKFVIENHDLVVTLGI